MFLQVASVGFLYVAVRVAIENRVEEAHNRAMDVLHLEEKLGVAWEKGIQESVLRSEWVVDFVNYFYFWGHFPFIVLLAFFLWVNNRQVYVKLRNAIIVFYAYRHCVLFNFSNSSTASYPRTWFC